MFHIRYKISTLYSGVQSSKVTASSLKNVLFNKVFALALIEIGNCNYSNN